MGPAPAVAAVRRAVRAALPRSGVVIIACSGGADSLALAAAAAFEAPRAGVNAGLVTVDHGLQPGSEAQARAVAQLGYDLGFDPVELIRVRVGRAGGPEAAARTARYGALDRVAAALDADVLLGHTLDDQAETVLLGLGRGSGPRSIAGMRPLDGRYRRPFLGVRRTTTHAACAALGLTPWQDPHNVDPAYQRVRLRQEVLPLLDDVLHGGVAEALARTAALVQEDLDALDELAAAHRPGGELPIAELAQLPRAIRTRVLRAWVRVHAAEPLSAERTAELDALITTWHGQGPIDIPGGFEVVRASGRLCMRRRSAKE
ncbi:MAG TPA: tRNA lysidine(34) synthetase TilS [Jatrophihabitantaceae bacterium]|nr:tRNA lysidine(34) synthetase TilS [Jatrophihabitantaceae bacterium]